MICNLEKNNVPGSKNNLVW